MNLLQKKSPNFTDLMSKQHKNDKEVAAKEEEIMS
jgi:hypothetical protein